MSIAYTERNFHSLKTLVRHFRWFWKYVSDKLKSKLTHNNLWNGRITPDMKVISTWAEKKIAFCTPHSFPYSLIKKYYVYGFIVKTVLTTQLMADRTKLSQPRHEWEPLALSQVCNLWNPFCIHNQPVQRTTVITYTSSKVPFDLQCNYIKEYIDNENILRDSKCKCFIL